MQRLRLFGACVGALEDVGYERTTVADITGRSRVSRRTFYELFANREECVVALLEDIVARVSRELAAANPDGLGWRERMRGGLWVVLCFFDREPALARTLVVHVARGSGRVLDTREALLRRLVALVDEGRGESARGAQASELSAEGVLGAVLAIVHARLLREEPLSGLFGELSALVVLPYLGPAVARRERQRCAPAPVSFNGPPQPVLAAVGDPLAGLPLRVTYRTARVLEGVGRQPGASNRQAGEYAGIPDPGQISKLLARLQRLGLLENHGAGGRAKGVPNSWALTPTGLRVARSLNAHATTLNGHAHANTQSGRTGTTREQHS